MKCQYKENSYSRSACSVLFTRNLAATTDENTVQPFSCPRFLTAQASDAAEPEKEDGMEDNRTASEIAERLVTEARNSTQEAKDGLRESKAEVEALRAELALAQAAEENAMSAAVDERRAAKERAVELQGIIDQAEINHALFREIMQSRLQSLKLAQDHENSCQQVRDDPTEMPQVTGEKMKDSSFNSHVLYQSYAVYTHCHNQ